MARPSKLNKYFTISEMPIIASRYWNMVHGAKPEDVEKDLKACRQCASCKEHGMVPKMQGGWHEGWRAVPRERRKHLH
jgi:multimeric flavodoxin WrbA